MRSFVFKNGRKLLGTQERGTEREGERGKNARRMVIVGGISAREFQQGEIATYSRPSPCVNEQPQSLIARLCLLSDFYYESPISYSGSIEISRGPRSTPSLVTT
ncbi:hypothetical protein CEXT_305231 [Caerostris extrusa]|uniref:Uncharacterized protein n=1 Tax=Caerostris extrusa TaxID=172846 RepID=A0AAV4XCQ5_CAEEX|nr:hypothetical protein CEXT_305231 [Caerostris extrusa]